MHEQRPIRDFIGVLRMAAFDGYTPVRGYTFMRKNPATGQIEISMILDPPEPKQTNARRWWKWWRK